VIYWLLHAQTWGEATAFGLIIGGALGNVIDRIRLGAVVDFLDFHWAEQHWPAFNVADSCIVLGACLILYLWGVRGKTEA
jgi:signal peptidase II